jgi:hypothetical protein
MIAAAIVVFGSAWVSQTVAQEIPDPGFLLKLTQPTQPSQDTITRDDLRDVPAPRVDRLSDTVRVSRGLDDPRCLPGDGMLVDPGRANRRASRRH